MTFGGNPTLDVHHYYAWAVARWLKTSAGQATLLAAAAFAATALIAVLSGTASTAVLLLLTVLAGIFQIASASKFHSAGRADPSLARASVRRLVALAVRAKATKEQVEEVFENGSATDAKKLMGPLSVEMSHVEEGAKHAVDDWLEFHSDALKDLTEEESNG